MVRKFYRRSLLSVLLIASIFIAERSTVSARELGPDQTRAFIEGYIHPIYQGLAQRAETLTLQLEGFCGEPSEKGLEDIRLRFRDLVLAWSAAEPIRFGPVRDDNRLEKVFFWPDPRSRGLRQVQKLLYDAEKNPAENVSDFSGRSVAVQGLPALEFLLFGKNSERLATTDGARRCAFARGIAANIEQIADTIDANWSGMGTFGGLMIQPSASNPLYRSTDEVLKEILKSAVEFIEIAKAIKLQPSLGEEMTKANPKKASFRRSGMTLPALLAGFQSLEKLHDTLGFRKLLSEEDRGTADQFHFEINQVISSLQKLIATGKDYPSLLKDPETYALLQYVTVPMQGVETLLAEIYPELLGLNLGFNSLDGD
ncbi:imelysin family protein [Sneathiella limimaris]|uniref:imelysin family protein n=1 Tax=Sneathiella limimaris TaxID=1964213 RepID=UPI001469C9F7|nr:imelysin family protein [Sneathiella limimaris]